MVNEWSELTINDFAHLLDATPNDFPKNCQQFVIDTDFRYRTIKGSERETLLLEAIKKVDSGTLTVSGPQKLPVWEKGWGENLASFEQSGKLSDLLPKFVRQNAPVRLNATDYIKPAAANFETAFVTVLRQFLFKKYFATVPAVFEFGCGTGLNLVELANMYPDIPLHGLDWSEAAVEILHKLADEKRFNISGHHFDMFHPNHDIDIPEGAGFLTIGAMEQLGTNYETFLQFMLDKKPSIVVHMETMYELYDEDNLFDYVVKRYLQERNWLQGYMAALEEHPGIEMVDVRRPFGSFFHDGYAITVWRPVYV